MRNTDETTFLEFTISRRINVSIKYLSDITWKVPWKGHHSTACQLCIHLTITKNKDPGTNSQLFALHLTLAMNYSTETLLSMLRSFLYSANV